MPLSAFKIEFQRQKLASKKDLVRLKSLYGLELPEIKNLNSSEFWDEIYADERDLNTQDGMTKDRIKTAVSFIPKGQQRILDIGAGMGYVEELISKDKKNEIYANDFSKISVENLKKRYKGNFSLQTVYGLKYPRILFDAVFFLEILEHIPPSKTFGVLKSIRNLLKTNGTLIVSVPMNEGLERMKYNPNGHVRMYTEDLIKAELEIAGFQVLKHKTLFAFPNFYYIKTIIARLSRRKYPNNIVLKAIKI